MSEQPITPAPAPNVTHDTDDIPHAELDRALKGRTPIWKPALTLGVLVIGVGALVAFGAMPRLEKRESLLATNKTLNSLSGRVQIGAIRVAPATRAITLPASLQPNAQADLFAQAVGYIRERRADIGDRVKAGDLLAVIDIPLVEEELNRARAALAEAEAARAEVEKTRSLAKTSLERWQAVEPPGAVSKQEIDERRSAFESAEASFNAADAVVATRRADVQRFERQQAFARVIAPFDGTITARNVEIGDYIGNAGPAGAPMFSIADTSTLRVYVDVPQAYASSIEVGQAATITVRETVGRTLTGTVARTSGALNERTRTLRVEVALPNADGGVLANAYGQVQFQVKLPGAPIIVPGSALIVRAEGPRVAIVDENSKLHYVSVVVARDLGTEVEIAQGLTGKERVVINMADEIPEGSTVETVIAAAPAGQTPGARAATGAGSSPATSTAPAPPTTSPTPVTAPASPATSVPARSTAPSPASPSK